jgi:hypothetical protein
MHGLQNIAVLLMIGTLSVFLFPLSAGPFTTTNGPATAFRAAAAALALLFSIATTVCFSLLLGAGYVRVAATPCSSSEALLVRLSALRC